MTSGALALEADKEGADVKFDWYLQNPQTNTGDAQTGWVEITDTLDAFVISPGDKLMYTSDAQYSGHVKGSDIKAKLSIAAKGANLFANNDVAQYVKVKFLLDGAQGTPAEVFLEGTIDAPEDFLGDDANDKVSVDVFIEFDPATPDQVAQAVADAVNFNQGLDLVLEQVAA